MRNKIFIGILICVGIIFIYTFQFGSDSNDLKQNQTQKAMSTNDAISEKQIEKQKKQLSESKKKNSIKPLVEDLDVIVSEQQFKKNGILIGGTTFPAIFEDGKYSDHLQSTIVRDINLIFHHITNYKILPYAKKSVVLNGLNLMVQKKIHFLGPKRYFPEVYKDNFGFILELNDRNQIVITQEIISAYKNAMEFEKKNKEAFKKIPHFISMMNSKPITEIAHMKIDELFYFLKDAEPLKKKYEKNPVELFNHFSELNWRKPSLLDICYLDKKLIAYTYMIDSEKIPILKTVLIYDQDDWKILIVRPGT